MTPEETVQAYYDALRSGDPLAPFFVESPATTKVGVSERLVGYAAVARGLADQTRRTEDWTVESRDLRTVERAGGAALADEVDLSWYDTETYTDHEYRTRWSGTLLPAGEDWAFAGLHVSVGHELE